MRSQPCRRRFAGNFLPCFVIAVSVLALGSCNSAESPPDEKTVGCDDGTGKTDCCPATPTAFAHCDQEGFTCSLPCPSGMRQTYHCGDGIWSSDKGRCCEPACAATGTCACADITGRKDCCPVCATLGADCCPSGTADGGGVCAAEGVSCWTACSSGNRTQLRCSGGTWVAGEAGTQSC
jgi:hypothetical protein